MLVLEFPLILTKPGVRKEVRGTRTQKVPLTQRSVADTVRVQYLSGARRWQPQVRGTIDRQADSLADESL